MDTTVKNVLRQHEYIVAAMDNNQKGFPKKYQRYGVTNKFVKLTAKWKKMFSINLFGVAILVVMIL